MTEALLKALGEVYPLTEKDVGEFRNLRASGMRFSIRAYTAKGLGQVSVMCASGFFGLMKMQTLIVNPSEKDLPLYSYDRIFAMGNDTLIVELYDTQLSPCNESTMEAVKAVYAALPERDPGQHWYDDIKLGASISKKGKRKETPLLDALAREHFLMYLATAPAGTTDGGEKRRKAAVYVDGLLEKGGPSTDVFKKALGEERTARLFREVLFGTEG